MGIELGNVAVLRTFRVLRALKTVAVVPGEGWVWWWYQVAVVLGEGWVWWWYQGAVVLVVVMMVVVVVVVMVVVMGVAVVAMVVVAMNGGVCGGSKWMVVAS